MTNNHDLNQINTRPAKIIYARLSGIYDADFTLEFGKDEQGKEYGFLTAPFLKWITDKEPPQLMMRTYRLYDRELACIEEQYFDNKVITIPIEDYPNSIDMEDILEKILPMEIMEQMLSGTYKISKTADLGMYHGMPSGRIKKIQTQCIKHLKDAGIEGIPEENGDISISYEGKPYSIRFNYDFDNNLICDYTYSWELKPSEDIEQCNRIKYFLYFISRIATIETTNRQVKAVLRDINPKLEQIGAYFKESVPIINETYERFNCLMEDTDKKHINTRPSRKIDVIIDGELLDKIPMDFVKDDNGIEHGILGIPVKLEDYRPSKYRTYLAGLNKLYCITGEMLACIEKQYFDKNIFSIPVEGYQGRGVSIEKLINRDLPPQILNQMLSGTFKPRASNKPGKKRSK